MGSKVKHSNFIVKSKTGFTGYGKGITLLCMTEVEESGI